MGFMRTTRREKRINRSLNNMYRDKSSNKNQSEDNLLFLSVKKPGSIKGKHHSYYEKIGNRSSKKSKDLKDF